MTDVKAVRPSSALLPAGVRGTPAAPVAQKSDAKKDDEKYVLVPSASPPSSSALPQFTEDELFKIYRGLSGSRGRRHKRLMLAGSLTQCAATAATTATRVLLLAQGATTADGLREGASVRVHRCTIRFQILWQNTTAPNSGVNNVNTIAQLPVRFVMFLDRMPAIGSTTWAENTSFPPAGNAAIVDTLNMTNPTWYNSIAPYNINTNGLRYHIFHDKVIYPGVNFQSIFVRDGVSGAETSYAVSGAHTNHEFTAEPNCVSTWYDETAGNILENTIGFHLIADTHSSVSTNRQLPYFNYTADISYSELPDQ